MTISTYASLRNKIASPYDIVRGIKPNASGSSGRLTSLWVDGGAPPTGVAPTTAVVPGPSLAGCLDIKNPTVARYLTQLAVHDIAPSTTTCFNMLMIADRLSHQGGLSGTGTGAQTTNLPTAALTRYTSGVGVMAAIEIYTAIGSTGQTLTASYTNTTPTSGRTSLAISYGGAGFNGQRRFMPLSLQQGDKGVTSVESVTGSGSTGTAGNFGVTLYKPLLYVPVLGLGYRQVYEAARHFGGIVQQYVASPHLFAVVLCGTHAVTGDMAFNIWTSE